MLYLWKLKTSGDLLNEFLDVKSSSGETHLSFNVANYHLSHCNISGARLETITTLEDVLKIAKLISDVDFRKAVLLNPDLLISTANESGIKIESKGLILCRN